MKVAGITGQQEVFISSVDRNFRINEFLIVEDPAQGDLVGEIVEAHTFNPYIPLNLGGEVADDEILQSLRAIGYEVDEETVYVGKLRLLREAEYPIHTGASLRTPIFDELRNFFVQTDKESGLLMGIIKNTDIVAKTMDEDLKNLTATFEDGKTIPQKDIPYLYHLRNMHQYPHIGIFGGSGSGKSYGLRVFLEEIMAKKIPAIMIDPHYEMGFSSISEEYDYENSHIVFQVGQDAGVKFDEISSSDLVQLLNTVSELSEIMINVVHSLFRRRETFNSFRDRLDSLIKALEEGNEEKIRDKIAKSEGSVETEYWQRVLAIFKKFGNFPHSSVTGIAWRLDALDREGIFKSGTEAIEEALMRGKLIVLQGSNRMLQVFTTYLVNKLYKKRREYQDGKTIGIKAEPFVPFLICTDEAHNFVPQGIDSPSKRIFREIAQEGRKYGIFLVLATQRPSLLDNTVTAQLNTKFIFRTVRATDMDTVREETDLATEEIKRLPYLQSGDVFISEASLGRTVFARIRKNFTEGPYAENPFDELANMRAEDNKKWSEMILPKLPTNDLEAMARQLEAEGYGTWTLESLEKTMGELEKEGLIKSENTILGMKKYERID